MYYIDLNTAPFEKSPATKNFEMLHLNVETGRSLDARTVCPLRPSLGLLKGSAVFLELSQTLIVVCGISAFT